MKLLVVDDERHATEWLETLFKDTGLFDVYKAHSGSEALSVIERCPIDIMVSDIRMPGMSGFELAEHVFARSPGCHVLFLSGYAMFDYVYRANRDNIKYLLKTEDDDVIMEAVLHERQAILEETTHPKKPEAQNAPIDIDAQLRRALEAQDVPGIQRAFDQLIIRHEGRNPDHAEASSDYQRALASVLPHLPRAMVLRGFSKLMKPDERHGWAQAFATLEQAALCAYRPVAPNGSEDRQRLARQIINFIEAHFSEDLSLARIARCVAYAPSYISRVYHQVTGENISDCVKRTRIEFAKRQLLTTELPIQDIAIKAGFDSPQYFATVFRSYTGYAPLEYRKAHLL